MGVTAHFQVQFQRLFNHAEKISRIPSGLHPYVGFLRKRSGDHPAAFGESRYW